MFRDSDDDSDNEDYEANTEKTFIPSYVEIAIDAHPNMFTKNENDMMPFRMCLEACLTVADSLIFTKDSRKWSPFAIIIARRNPILMNFKNSILDTVKMLKNKLSLPDKALKEEFERDYDLELSNFFLNCKKVFNDIKSPFYKRILIYITNDNCPIPKTDEQRKFKAITEVQTFPGNKIDFQLVSIRDDFDYKIFYNELFSVINISLIEEICLDIEGLVQKLSSVIIRKLFKRKLLLYPLKGNTSHYIECLYWNPLHSAATTIKTHKFTRDGKLIKGIRMQEQNSAFKIKCNSKSSKRDQLNDIKITFTERKAMLNCSLPIGFTLLYVSKRQTDVGCITYKPHLLEEDLKQSLPYFKKIWQYCVDMDRVLVCVEKQRQPDKIKFVELIPILRDGYNVFLVKRLPYSNQVLYPPEKEYPNEDVKPERKELIASLVDKLTFDFDVSMLPDPVFSKKKAYYKAKLLGESVKEDSDPEEYLVKFAKDEQELIEKINSSFCFISKKRKSEASKITGNKKRN